ncbi:MAG: class I SAM-dependent methyltransferase [Rhizobiaceae bacterium]|jgi:ubiquinone/menaquinone biosynthesis C-methylase UbiE|nr:class I SAM-dependent methyltransferase [Rhizobiaceae bacterium]
MRPDPSREAYLSFFETAYDTVNYGKSLAARVLDHGHVILEKPFGRDSHFSTVLEVGAGHGEHAPHVRHGYDRYIMTDWRADEMRRRWPADKCRAAKIEIEAQDATRLTHGDNSVDRLIASHVLEHLPEPHKVLREWSRVVKPGGIISIALPCDPGFLWRFGRNFGPRRNNLANGNTHYDYWMAREHVNAIQNLWTMIDYYFPERREAWFPAMVKSFDMNLVFVTHLVNRKDAA